MKKHKEQHMHEGMRSPTMPKKEFEKAQGELGHECKMKYGTEFGNPNSLDKMTEGLASYVKKNHMKYE